MVANERWVGAIVYHEIETFPGSWTVTHRISEIPELIGVGEVVHDRLQCREIGVDVGYD